MHGTCATLRLNASIWVASEGPPCSLFLWEAWCRVQFNLAGLNQHLKWANSSFEVNSLQSLHFWSSSNLEVVFLFVGGGKRSEWVKVRELRTKTINFNSNKWHLNHPKCCILRCFGFFVAQDSVEALRTASERQARLGPPRISIFASRRPWGFPWFYMMIWRRVVGGGTVVGDWSFFGDLFLFFSLDVYLVSEVRRIHEFRAEVVWWFLCPAVEGDPTTQSRRPMKG